MPEDAIATLEAPVETADETSVDTGIDESTEEAPVDGAESTEEAEPVETSTETGPIIDGKRLSEGAKATLAEIKAKDPKLAAQIKSALFSADALRRQLPGGLKEVATLRQQIEEIGGPDGIQALKAEQQEWNALDQQFAAGDPKFVDNIAEGSPESFVALAPAVFAKYAELNQEGYSAYVSKVFVADMQAEGIPLALERLQDFIGDNPKAMEIWQKIAGYVNRVNGMAQKPVNSPVKPGNAAPDDRERQLTEREESLTRTEWKGATDSERMNVFNSEFARLTAGRKISDVQKAAIKELYASRLMAAARKTQNFNSNIDRYFSSRDRAGYLRYMGSFYKQEIPKALRSAIDSVMPSKPGPAARPPVAAAPVSAGKPATGFAWVASAPSASSVDMTHPFNTQANWSAGKAVLKNGSKVTWKKQ
jgi:hypothetical protein